MSYQITGVEVSHPAGINFTDLLDGSISLVSTLNAELILLAEENGAFKNILCKEITTLDGFWTYWAFKRKYPEVTGVIKQSGSNMIFELAEYCIKNSVKLMLLGGEEQTNSVAVETLSGANSNQIVGYSPKFENYPFSDENRESIRERIRKEKPKFIVTAFGAPKQEFWAKDDIEFLKESNVKAVFFFGGALDVVAGKFKRAPKWVQYSGLESPWRLIQDPKRFQREKRKLQFLKKILIGDY